ncbi:MAG: Gx transporter family protein [Ruminococcus sp.]|nr:Gx transporter family protein [Ruminococcus sp.]
MKMKSTHMHIKDITRLALFIAIALTIFVLESQIPIPIAIPGVKLGLANIVTLYLINQYSTKEALLVLIVRVILGSVFAGQLMSFAYSLVGGLLSLSVMALANKIQKGENVWFTSILGGIFHNVGQIIVAIIVLGSFNVVYYLSVLGICGIVTGLFTGLIVQAFIKSMKKLNIH